MLSSTAKADDTALDRGLAHTFVHVPCSSRVDIRACAACNAVMTASETAGASALSLSDASRGTCLAYRRGSASGGRLSGGYALQ